MNKLTSKSTDEQLRDKAYLIATGHHLTEDFRYDEFQQVDISEHLWQMVEDWPINELESHIAGVADSIYYALKELRDEPTN